MILYFQTAQTVLTVHLLGLWINREFRDWKPDSPEHNHSQSFAVMLQKQLYVTRLTEDICIHTVSQQANCWFDTTQLEAKQPSLRPAFTGFHALFPTVSEMPTQAGKCVCSIQKISATVKSMQRQAVVSSLKHGILGFLKGYMKVCPILWFKQSIWRLSKLILGPLATGRKENKKKERIARGHMICSILYKYLPWKLHHWAIPSFGTDICRQDLPESPSFLQE